MLNKNELILPSAYALEGRGINPGTQRNSNIKYPRTPHLPFSLGRTSDDKVLSSTDHFLGKDIVVTEKIDGENVTMYRDGFHARSLDSRHHPSRNWLAKFHAEICYEIPEDMRICGENMYAKHSIAYDNLPSYFLGFSVWEQDHALSWDDTIDYFELIGITPVKELYRGEFNLPRLGALAKSLNTDVTEGFVIRLADSFTYDSFSVSVAKWVREKHVQTDQHWMHSEIIANKLRS